MWWEQGWRQNAAGRKVRPVREGKLDVLLSPAAGLCPAMPAEAWAWAWAWGAPPPPAAQGAAPADEAESDAACVAAAGAAGRAAAESTAWPPPGGFEADQLPPWTRDIVGSKPWFSARRDGRLMGLGMAGPGFFTTGAPLPPPYPAGQVGRRVQFSICVELAKHSRPAC